MAFKRNGRKEEKSKKYIGRWAGYVVVAAAAAAGVHCNCSRCTGASVPFVKRPPLPR